MNLKIQEGSTGLNVSDSDMMVSGKRGLSEAEPVLRDNGDRCVAQVGGTRRQREFHSVPLHGS